MDDLSRRAALTGATGAGLSVLFGSPQLAQGAEPADATELLVVGPYKLGDWLDESKLQFDRKTSDIKLGEVAREAIVKSFNECSVYAIDQRLRPKDGPVRFDTENAPRIALT